METVIARLDDGHLWKFSRYFDNPQYWSSPAHRTWMTTPKDVLHVLRVEIQSRTPGRRGAGVGWNCLSAEPREAQLTPDEFEMYDLDAGPMEVVNRYGDSDYLDQQDRLAQLLEDQRELKRLTPTCGEVPGGKVVFGQS